MNTLQQTIRISQEDYLEIGIEAFLIARKAENLAVGTLKFYKEKLTIFNNFCLSQEIKQISQITPTTIREFMLFLRNKGNNDGGIHAIYRSIKAFLRWYEREFEPEGWSNPIKKVKAPRVAVEPLDPANIDDVEKMMKACDNGIIGKRDKAIMLFLLDSGVRAKELLAIRLDEINILTGEVLIRSGKGRKPRFVYCGEKTRKAIRQYLKLRKDISPILWITKSEEPLSYWGLVEVMRRRSEMAKVKSPSLHSFRRFYALACLRNGMDIFSLSLSMGHADLQILKRYLKESKDDIQDAHKRASPVDHLK